MDHTDKNHNSSNNSTSPLDLTDHDIIPKSCNENITSSFTDLLLARNEDSSWQPEIIMDIPVPQYIKELLPVNAIHGNAIDIIPFTIKPSLMLSTLLKHQYNYPKNCTFCFEGYEGVERGDDLKKDIINAAALHGTVLTVDINDHYKARGNKYVHVFLSYQTSLLFTIKFLLTILLLY